MANKITQFLLEVKETKGRGYLVGGCVRDKLLGVPSKDIDIEVYGLEVGVLEKIIEKHSKVNQVGKAFGVYIFDKNVKISLPRQEVRIGKGHKGFKIVVDSKLDQKEACRRRDLTINAMLYDPLTDELFDYYGGQEDLANKKIKLVDDRTFREDPLRVLRAAKFAARLGFEISPSTTGLCISMVEELKDLPKERIFKELQPILMESEFPSIALRWLRLIGALNVILPELNALYNVIQGQKWHSEGDAFEHTMRVIDYYSPKERTLVLMLALLFHDLGKANVTMEVKGLHISFHGHAKAGVPLAIQALDRLTEEKKLVKQVLNLIEYHMKPFNWTKSKPTKKGIRRLATKTNILSLLKLHKADIEGRVTREKSDDSHIKQALEIYNKIESQIDPILLGRHIMGEFGIPSGPRIGIILKKAYEAQLNGEFDSVKKGLEWVEKEIKDGKN